MEAMVSIYRLADPRAPERVRYVGQTAGALETRLKQHVRDARRGLRGHRFNWIRSLLTAGISPAIESVATVPAAEWQQHERHWIRHYLEAGHLLTNGSAGGDGLDSASWKRVWSDPALRARQSENMRRRQSSPEARKTIGEKSALAFANPVTRARHGAAVRRALSQPSVRTLLSEIRKSSWRDPQIRARRVEGLRRTMATPEYLAKRSRVAKEVWQRSVGRKAAQVKRLNQQWADPVQRARIVARVRATKGTQAGRERTRMAALLGWETRRRNQQRKSQCTS